MLFVQLKGCFCILNLIQVPVDTGGAWLSSARVVKCRVKSHNERNPCLQLCRRLRWYPLERLPVINRRKVRTTSSHHAPYVLGDTRATMAGTMGCNLARVCQPQKPGLSSDCRLQLACMKAESLVIAGQPHGGEYCSRALYTPPVTPWKLAQPKVVTLTNRRRAPNAGLVTRVKS